MVLRIAMTTSLIAVLALSASPAAASDRDDIIALVQAYNDAGNKGDRAGYAAACTSDATVVDHVPPYVFGAPAACADEYDAVVAFGAANQIDTNGLYQKIDDPVFFEQSGDTAYAVFPGTDWFSQRGRKMVEKTYFTAVLRREAGHWRIARMTYSSLGWSPRRPLRHSAAARRKP